MLIALSRSTLISYLIRSLLRYALDMSCIVLRFVLIHVCLFFLEFGVMDNYEHNIFDVFLEYCGTNEKMSKTSTWQTCIFYVNFVNFSPWMTKILRNQYKEFSKCCKMVSGIEQNLWTEVLNSDVVLNRRFKYLLVFSSPW